LFFKNLNFIIFQSEILTKDPPYNAKVIVDVGLSGNGYYVREIADYLKKKSKI